MATWSKKIGLAVLNLGLMTMTPNFASANDCGACDPCDLGSDPCQDSCWSGFDLSVDFLYWKTCVDDLTYAASVSAVTPTTNGLSSRDVEYYNLCPKWKPGFRLTLGKDDVMCGLRFEGSYTWLKSKDSHRSYSSVCGVPVTTPATNGAYFESPLIHPLLANTLPEVGDPAVIPVNSYVAARWEGTYQNWDLLFSYDACSSRCYSLNPFFGIAGLKFHQQLDVALAPTCGSDIGLKRLHWENDYFGVGFKAGSMYTYQVCDGLSLFAKGSMTIVTGNSDNKYNRNRQEIHAPTSDLTVAPTPGVLLGSLSFYDDDCCQFIPGWHMQLGFNYQSEFCGCESNIHFGWEYQLWDNIAGPRRFTGNPRDTPTTAPEFNPITDLTAADIVSYAGQSSLSTLGFHGFFVGFDFDF